MPPLLEFVVIIFTMMGAFFLMFLLMYLLAVVLFPIERSISKMIWSNQPPPAVAKKNFLQGFQQETPVLTSPSPSPSLPHPGGCT